MPQSPEPGVSLLKLSADMVVILLGVAGGVASYLRDYIRTGGKEPMRIGLFFAHGVVSGFSGYIVAQTVYQFSPEWFTVAAGIGGYLGTQGLDWVATLLKERFAPNTPQAPKDKTP